MTALAMPATTVKSKSARMSHFDIDSFEIGVDNRCSRCISHQIDDFIGQLRDSRHTIRSFGGSQTATVKVGIIQWKWMDNNGMIHKFIIPNSFYVPEGGVRLLLSPQHWARSTTGKNPKRVGGVRSETLGDRVTLFWGNRKYKLTVPLCRKTNVATFRLAPSNAHFDVFCRNAGIMYDESIHDPIIVQPVTSDTTPEENQTHHDREWPSAQESTLVRFDIQGPKTITDENRLTSLEIIKDAEGEEANLASEFLSLHHRCGHIGFDKMKEMAWQRIIPRKFSSAPTPACTACMYAKAVKRKWRDKSRTNYQPSEATVPGKRVSVDQMVSPMPGFVAQMTGVLTTNRHMYATIYVDQASKLGYTYLQKTASAEETLEGKRSFELFALRHGIRVQSYHADNGIFYANKWVDDCRRNNQNFSFSAVGAHHQKRICGKAHPHSPRAGYGTMLIHASAKLPAAITTHLWPFTICMATLMIKETPNMGDHIKRSPIQIFAASMVQPNQKHWQTFGCPVYILDRALQSNAPFHKWNKRSKVGIYLGRSPHHARNVALVLDRTTGLVSPQFHVSFDPKFHTLQKDDYDQTWQLKAGFITSIPRLKAHALAPSLRGRNTSEAQSHLYDAHAHNASKARNDTLREE